MNKKWSVIGILTLLLIATGCAQNSSKQKTSSSETTKVELKTTDYSKLSDSEKNEMSFSFVRESKDNGSNVNLKIINRSSKNVVFDKAKFLLIHKDGDTLTSSADGNKIVKSNSTTSIKSLFTEVENSEFQSVGLFCYKNSKNELAYTEVGNTIYKSSDLTNVDLKKGFNGEGKSKKKDNSYENTEGKDKNKDTDNKQTNDSPVNSNDAQKQDSEEKKEATPVETIINIQQAIDLVARKDGQAPEGTGYVIMTDSTSDASGKVLTATGQRVYWVRLYKKGATTGDALGDWTVYPSGVIEQGAPEK